MYIQENKQDLIVIVLLWNDHLTIGCTEQFIIQIQKIESHFFYHCVTTQK